MNFLSNINSPILNYTNISSIFGTGVYTKSVNFSSPSSYSLQDLQLSLYIIDPSNTQILASLYSGTSQLTEFNFTSQFAYGQSDYTLIPQTPIQFQPQINYSLQLTAYSDFSNGVLWDSGNRPTGLGILQAYYLNNSSSSIYNIFQLDVLPVSVPFTGSFLLPLIIFCLLFFRVL